MRKITRRDLTKMGASAIAASPVTFVGPAVFAESNMTKMRIGSLPFLDFVPLYAAKELGYFENERLDITLAPLAGGAGGAAAFTALVSGDLQATISTTIADIIVANKHLQFPMIGCGPVTGSPPSKSTAALLTLKSGGMTSGKVWNHKRIGVNILDSVSWLCTRLWVDAHGGDSSTLSFVEIQVPQLNDALLHGRIDAMLQNEPFVSTLMETAGSKVELISWIYPDVLPDSMVAGLFASQRYIAKNKAAVEAFSEAYNKGIEWVQHNRRTPQLYKLISNFTKLPERKLQHMLGWPDFRTTVSPHSLAEIANAMTKYKLIDKSPDIRSLIFPAILS